MWLGDSMKKYKIDNHIITADSPTKALEIHKLLDTKCKDGTAADIVKDLKSRFPGIQLHTESVTGRWTTKGNHWTEIEVTSYGENNKKSVQDYLRYLANKYKTEFSWGTRSENGILINDSISDEDVDQLSEEERQAIEDYKRAIAETNDPKMLKLFAHILKEETEHLEELQSGEMEDSLRDASAKLIKQSGMPVAVEVNGIRYPIGDEPKASKMASYSNEYGLEHIMTVRVDGKVYEIYDSGFGNMLGSRDRVAVEDSFKD